MSERSFQELAQDLDRLEAIADQWEAEKRGTTRAIRTTVEALQAEAFRRLIRTIKDEPGGLAALKKAVEDPWVRNVLTFHGVLRPPEPTLEEKVEAALESVRPTLKSHSGNVELVRVVSPEEVHIRLIGSCDGCSFSEATVRIGIETAIQAAVPTLKVLKVVDPGVRADGLVQLGAKGLKVSASPYSKPWQDAGPVEAVSEGQVRAVELSGASVLLTKIDGTLHAYPNACTHLGMPLDGGSVADGILECPYHAFRYDLKTGECLTALEVQLPPYPVRTEAGRVMVQVTV